MKPEVNSLTGLALWSRQSFVAFGKTGNLKCDLIWTAPIWTL
jgi:hypothetical protein